MPPDARLEDAAHLQALRDPTPRLDLKPRHILQQDRVLSRAAKLRRLAGPLGTAALVHVGFAVALVYLLTFREVAPPQEVVTPVELVTLPPEPPKPAAAKGGGGPAQASAEQKAQATPVAPDPHPPAPPRLQPLAPEPPKTEEAVQPRPAPAPAPPGGTAAPKLVAAPAEPTRAAAEASQDKPANLEPDRHQTDEATHEARPAEVPRALATSDPEASFAVPTPLPPKPNPVDKPAPPVPAKVPSAADKLAAALPMDISAMPLSFRNVLSGNGAQVSAAYKGLVYGRFSRNPEVAEQARRQRLRGQVIVAFSIDDAGRISELAVAQSSGNATLDALGLEMIRAAAPFPPPPPEAQRSFTPALSFGE